METRHKMQGLLNSLTGPNANIELSFSDSATRKFRKIDATASASDGAKLLVFHSGEDVAGELKLMVQGGKKIDHIGIRVELHGVVELLTDKSICEICTYTKEVAGPGHLSGLAALKWSFPKAILPADSYTGINARIRYFVRAVVLRQGYSGLASLSREVEFAVETVRPTRAPQAQAQPAQAQEDTSAKLEVGIEDCLHIEFQYDKTRLGLSDVLTGHVDFLLVRIRIKHSEVALIRKETVHAGTGGGGTGGAGAGAKDSVTESETISRFEIMDGAPVKGERIPLRMFLAGLDVGPTLPAVGPGMVVTGAAGETSVIPSPLPALAVKYFLNLVLVDEEDRRYFKQHEVVLERRS